MISLNCCQKYNVEANHLKDVYDEKEIIVKDLIEMGYEDEDPQMAEDIRKEIEDICGNKIINSIEDAEPIGPKNMFDVLVVAPCTGNTTAKLAAGIIDTPVTMAAKSHLIIGRPVVIALATNDALGASAQNLGRMLNTKNIYFVPLYSSFYY